MKLRPLQEADDIDHMVDLYIGMNDDFLPACSRVSRNTLHKHWMSRSFIRIVEDAEGAMLGWIMAATVAPGHCDYKMLQQMYYASNLSGFAAAKCLILAHEALAEEAERLGLPYAMSACSHLDEKQQLCKILKHKGWDTRGYIAIWRTSHFKGN
jgi:hypothetical protein